MKSKEDLKGLSVEELQEKLEQAMEELENLQLQQASHQISNPIRIRFVRREIARLKTVIHQHELGLAKEA
jgi:large subunit ribosomal protein L29